MINFLSKTYGCKVNLYNSQLLYENLVKTGIYTNDIAKPYDLCLVNACVVTKHAEKEVIRYCKKIQLQGIKVIVYGCLSWELKGELQKIGILFQDYQDLLINLTTCATTKPEFLSSISNFQDRTRAFVKIQTGCNQFCSYCIVPFVRGEYKSRPSKEIVAEVKQLVQTGYREIVLTGTQIGLYQEDCTKHVTLVDLLEELETTFMNDLYRIRISSIGPTFVTQEMISFLSRSKLFCNHLHISLQSGSNSVLEKMNRKYSSEYFLDLSNKLKLARKDFCISTDVIVGFPGETEEDFQATLNLCKEVNFSKIHVFPYSPRAGTIAYQNKSLLLPGELKKRTRALLELSKILSYNVKQEFIGKNVEVLIEEDSSGFTTNYLRVVLKNRCNRKGRLASVSVGGCDADALYESNLT